MLNDPAELSKKRFTYFLIAGGINTVFGLLVYSICIISGMAIWLSLLISMILGTIFNFITTGGYVFRQLSLTLFPRFLLCYLCIYSVNLLLMELISNWINSSILSQAIISVPLALLSYYLMQRYVFISKQPI